MPPADLQPELLARLGVLLVEDDELVRRGYAQSLALADIEVRAVGDAEAALALLARDADRLPGAIVSDVNLPGRDGLALLREARRIDPELPVLLVTGHGDVPMAVRAMRDGALDFIEKPFPAERLVTAARRALERRALVLDNRALRERLAAGGERPLVGDSPAMVELRRLVAALAPASVDILIRGETGTGKEVVARALHAASGRRGPFVAINCAALPETVFESEIFGHEPGAFTGATKRRIGKIEHASGGTLFLDEIETMPLALQAKLLRVLQERTIERLGGNDEIAVDCRVLAGVKGDLAALAAAGRFRADLYYRLDVASVSLPPLRERKGDIELLMRHFVTEAAARHGRPAPDWTPADLLRWQLHDWPGNVRELRNTAERVCLGLPDGLAPADAAGLSLAAQLERAERAFIETALRQCDGQVVRAAEQLQLPRKTLYDRMARLGIEPERFRR